MPSDLQSPEISHLANDVPNETLGIVDACAEENEENFIMARIVKGRISKENFDDFLESEGMLAEAEDVAIKRVLAWQIAEGMKAEGITKTVMASRMKTDRRQLDRLLDPENKSVTLSTLRRAATALGRKLYVEIG